MSHAALRPAAWSRRKTSPSSSRAWITRGERRPEPLHPAALLIDQDGSVRPPDGTPKIRHQPSDLIEAGHVPCKQDEPPRPMGGEERRLLVRERLAAATENHCL